MELSNEVKHKLEEVVEVWADDHLDGRPAILASGVYFQLEKKLREQTEKIEKTFPLEKTESGLTQRAADECPTCAGLGFVNDNRGRRGVDCSDCNGSGIRR